MALEASHIRFALDLKEKFGVLDVDAYVAGSIYPDSRYVTGVDREATHLKGFRTDPMFKVSDFNKGWFVHLLCDDIQHDLMKEKLPQTSEGDGTESWIKRTAIKILQDIDDAQKFDVGAYLKCLAHVETPNGESDEAMHSYAQIFFTMYADPGKVSISDAHDMWVRFGIGEDLAGKVREQTEKYAADRSVVAIVPTLYPEMLARARTA